MPVTTFAVGDPLNEAADFEALPVGTIIGPPARSEERYTKQSNGLWSYNNRPDHYDTGNFSTGGYNVVIALPEGYTPGERPILSVEQFQWAFRDGALAGAERNGISMEPVLRALERMGLHPDKFPIGPGVPVKSITERDRLPNGTVLYTGNPETPGRLTVQAKVKGAWVNVIGERGTLDTDPPPKVLSVLDAPEPEWFTRNGDESDEEAITRFKAVAWIVGERAKFKQGWCSTFETVMRQLGVTATALSAVKVNGFGVGETVNIEQQATLPQGTLLRWASTDHSGVFAVYVRDDSATNRTHTRRLLGSNEGTAVRLGHMHDQCMIVALPLEGLQGIRWECGTANRMLQHLPPGTRFTYDRSTDRFVVARGGSDRPIANWNNNWSMGHVPERGDYRLADFGSNRVIVTYLPGVPA